MSMESSAKKKLLVVLLWLFIAVAGFCVYVLIWKPFRDDQLVNDTSTQSEGHFKHKVVLRADSFSGYCILRSDKMAEHLKAESIKLEIQDDQADYVARLEALRDGKAHMAVFTVDSLLTAGAAIGKHPATIVMVIDETQGADAIVAYKTAAESIEDLNKPNAGFVLTPGSPSEFLARIVVAEFSLPMMPKDSKRWIFPAKGVADVYDKFKKASRSEPKAYVLWEPYVSKAKSDKDVGILLGSDKLKGYIVDVLVARRQFLADSPDLVEAVVKAYLRAAHFHGKSGMAPLVIQDAAGAGEHVSAKEAQQLVDGIRWKNVLENYAHFGLLSAEEAQGLDALENIIRKIGNVLVTTGAASREQVNVPPNTLFYDRTMKGLRDVNFHPSIIPGDFDPVRGRDELPPLSESEWKQLFRVGRMRIPPLSFRTASSELNIQSKRNLLELATTLESMPMYYLLVTGHARARGDMQANMQLAKDRADAAAEYLTGDLGISVNRVRAIAEKPKAIGSEAQSVTFGLLQRSY